MSCTSGGILDIYMEPHLPQPQLLLIGDSPVVLALGKLAQVLDFSITTMTGADLSQAPVNERTYIVVATHGQYDEDVLEHALRSPARYIGMVASHRRAKAVMDYLRGSGLTEQQVERLKAPAGLDVGAVTPDEIAASILAELVQVRRRGPLGRSGTLRESQETQESHHEASQVGHTHVEIPQASPDIAGTATDPVCGMIVDIATARHHTVLNGSDYYFCCAACKRLFERNPQEYLVENER
jgi:xanthine dehydrogenase accessory factor